MDSTYEGGYELDFVLPPPNTLKCSICLFVARDAQQVTCCGKLFCMDCLGRCEQGTCPHCRCTDYCNTWMPDKRAVQQIKSLRVRCKNRKQGCSWIRELRNLDEHLKICEYELLPCKYKCEQENQTCHILRKDLEKHVQDECPKRPYTCPNCQQEGEHFNMTTVHPEICPKVKVKCPKPLCRSKVQRSNLTTHRSKCQYERIPCKYAVLGCEERPIRKDLQEHEQDKKRHFNIANETISSKNKKIKLLEDTLSKKNGLPTFKLKEFHTHKNDNLQFFSPPFYSSTNGYKLKICITANGENDGEGTHVSVYVYLMKGDNDDSLSWPFTGSVTIEVLNQLEDSNHHKRTIDDFHETEESSMRVTEGEMGTGWGTGKFIPHTAIEFNPDKNCQYLKDDTLIFRVSVEPTDYKPWLECTM